MTVRFKLWHPAPALVDRICDVFIEFLKPLMIGSKSGIFLKSLVAVQPMLRKKTKAFVASVGHRLRLFYLPPYSPDRNPGRTGVETFEG
jgi:hypothetical protein